MKLDTNGRDYKIVKRMVEDNILDYVAVDLKHTIYNYHLATGTKQSNGFFYSYDQLLQFLLKGNVEYEYRVTLIKGMHHAEDIETMAHMIRGAKHLYLQNYKEGNTLDPNF